MRMGWVAHLVNLIQQDRKTNNRSRKLAAITRKSWLKNYDHLFMYIKYNLDTCARNSKANDRTGI